MGITCSQQQKTDQTLVSLLTLNCNPLEFSQEWVLVEARVRMTHSLTRLRVPERKMEAVGVWTPAELCNWWIIWAAVRSGEGSALVHQTEQRSRDRRATQRGCGSPAAAERMAGRLLPNEARKTHASQSWSCRLLGREGYFSIRFPKCRKHQVRGQNHVASQQRWIEFSL